MIYNVHIEPLELMTLYDLKGSQEALGRWCGAALPGFPGTPLTYEADGGKELMWLAPGHWILRAPLSQEDALTGALKPEEAPEAVSIVRISDSMNFFSISGPEADEVMAVATPLDIHRDVFPAGSAAFTEAYQIKALIIRREPGYHLGVDRSYAPMIADYLSRTVSP